MGKQRNKWNTNRNPKNNQKGGAQLSESASPFIGILGNSLQFCGQPATPQQPVGNQQQQPRPPLPQPPPAGLPSAGQPSQQQQQPLPSSVFAPAPAALFPAAYRHLFGYPVTHIGYPQPLLGQIQQHSMPSFGGHMQSGQQQPTNSAAVFQAMSIQQPLDNNYYMDSGASSHMSFNSGNMFSLTPCNSKSIMVGNGAVLPVTHVGHTILLNLILLVLL